MPITWDCTARRSIRAASSLATSHKPSVIWRLSEPPPLSIANSSGQTEGTTSESSPMAAMLPRSLVSLQQELTDTLLALDAPGAERVLEQAFALYSIEDVCLRLLEPLLVDIG